MGVGGFFLVVVIFGGFILGGFFVSFQKYVIGDVNWGIVSKEVFIGFVVGGVGVGIINFVGIQVLKYFDIVVVVIIKFSVCDEVRFVQIGLKGIFNVNIVVNNVLKLVVKSGDFDVFEIMYIYYFVGLVVFNFVVFNM